MVKMVGGVPVFVPCHHEDGFIVRPEEIAKRVTDKTKVLILNSPSNPLGCVIPRKTLEQIAALAVEKQFYVISDEIYESSSTTAASMSPSPLWARRSRSRPWSSTARARPTP